MRPAAGRAVQGGSLKAILGVFNARHKRVRVLLTVLAIVAGVVLFAENSVLEGLSISFRRDPLAPTGLVDTGGWRGMAAHLGHRARELGWSLPLIMLTLFVLLRLSRLGTDLWAKMLVARMEIESRTEVEAEVVEHLQRQSDEFFGGRPVGEILNWFSTDVDRALDARDSSNQVFRLLVMIGGNLYFFILQDWRLAAAGVLSCAFGAAWMSRAARPIGRTERELFDQDDAVRGRFEDVLRAAPEVQVGNLFRQSARYTGGAQRERDVRYLRVSWLDERLHFVQGAASLLGMATLFLVVLYFLQASNPDRAVALVPIVLKAMPELFSNASAVVLQRLTQERSRISIERLLEFDSPMDLAAAVIAPAALLPPLSKLRFDHVSYQYPASTGLPQGGVQDVSTELEPGRWIALTGPTGAGKSTLLQLLVGRLQPQGGAVSYGGQDLRQISPGQRAEVLSLMPQRVLVLDASIRENVTFGRSAVESQLLAPTDLQVLEAAGLADVCRRKALSMVPAREELDGALGRRILQLRAEAWARLDGLGVEYRRYGRASVDPQHWVLEHLLQGCSDRGQAVARLATAHARRRLRRMAGSSLGAALVQQGQDTLLDSRQVLRAPTYQAFLRVAPFYLEVRTWQLWSSALPFSEKQLMSNAERALLMSVALTSPAGEAGATRWRPQAGWAVQVAVLRALLGSVSRPLDAAVLHPFLTWRENLLFAAPVPHDDRTAARIEQMLLDLVDSAELTEALTHVGLEFQAGCDGLRLSGGQGQLVALCRTLLRGTPVVVLDEPTSALDPKSRARVASLLQRWKKDRIIVTTSHDPELIRQADEIRVLEAGRLARFGLFGELIRDAETRRPVAPVDSSAGGAQLGSRLNNGSSSPPGSARPAPPGPSESTSPSTQSPVLPDEPFTPTGHPTATDRR